MLGGMDVFGNYGVDKTLIEKYFCETDNFPYINLRPTYIIGKDNHNYREKYYFDSIINNQHIELGPESNKIVSFVFADDVSNIICRFVTEKCELRQSYNVNGDEHITIQTFIETISDIVGLPHQIELIQEEGKFQDTHFIFSNEKVKSQLNYKFKSLTKGLTEFYEYTY